MTMQNLNKDITQVTWKKMPLKEINQEIKPESAESLKTTTTGLKKRYLPNSQNSRAKSRQTDRVFPSLKKERFDEM